LLPLETTLEKEKTLTQTEGTHLESGHRIRGYEIHHGVTREVSFIPVLARSTVGGVLAHGLELSPVWGTYLHGVFDSDEFRRWFLDRVRSRKGMRPLGKVQARYDLEHGIDELARQVRESLDMNAIYQALRL
jgi:adenosylcobyric acid synthase